MKHELLNSHSQIYVTACGRDFTTRRAGLAHESYCPACNRLAELDNAVVVNQVSAGVAKGRLDDAANHAM